MKVRQRKCFTVYRGANKYRDVYIPFNTEYPETKKEGVQELRSSYQVIIDELHYMLGCINLLKAPLLRPNTKTNWYDSLLKLVDDMDEIQKMLPKQPSQQPISEDDIPF
jgi:hypothetical protein